MIGTVIYFVGALLASWPCYRLVLDLTTSSTPSLGIDNTDRVFAGVFGTLVAVAWPLVLVGVVGFRISRRIWTRVLDLDDERERVR